MLPARGKLQIKEFDNGAKNERGHHAGEDAGPKPQEIHERVPGPEIPEGGGKHHGSSQHQEDSSIDPREDHKDLRCSPNATT